jgi:diguanylate cyclase (GGDEF)-like protein/PAS domain S-box-containing protein
MSSRAAANLSALIESSKSLIWSVDLEYRLTVFNSALRQHFEEIFGLRPEMGMRPQDLVPPERAELMPPLYARALTEGAFQTEFQLANGHTLELTLSPIIVDGKATGVSVLGKDITKRKTGEKALQEAEKKYRDIFDGALEGMFQLSPEGRPLVVNRALARMLGYDSPENFLASVTDVVQQEWVNPEEHASYAEGMAGEGFVRSLEGRLKRKDGSTIWGLFTARNVCDADGKLLYQEGFIIDITKRKAIEAALREADKKYRDIFDGALEGIFQISSESKLLIANPALARMLGYDSPEELKAAVTNVAEQLWADPEEQARFRQLIGEQGVVGEFKCHFRRSDGSIRWASLNARRVCDADGRFLYFEGFVGDITKRMEAETELRESEARYRSTFEQAAVGIAHTSFKGEYLRCNARFAEIAGYPLEEIPSLTVQQMTHPEDLAQSESVRIRLSQGEANQAYIEKRLIRKDGSLIWVRMTTWPQYDSEGRMLYLVSLAEDINDRKAAEERLDAAVEALRLGEERYRTVFLTSIDGITISRQEDGKFLDINDAFLRMFGHEREEVLGRTAQEIHLWASQQDRQKLVEAMGKESVCRNQEFQLCKKSGEKLWAMLSTAQIELDGVPCILLVVRDISEAKAAAEALRVSEERHRVAFQTSIDAIVISRMEDGKYLDVNRAFLSMFGYERNEVIGHTALELGVWLNPGERLRMVKTLRKKSLCRDMEFQFIKKNGQKFWALVSGSLIELDGIPSLLLVVRDISDAKAAVEALRVSEERYRVAFQTSIDSIVISHQEDGKFVDVNEASLRMFGFEGENVLGRTALELGVWPNPEDRHKLVETLRKESASRDMEFQFIKKNGQKFWALMSGSKIELDGVHSILLVIRDISDAKAAAEALRLSEERYRTVFQTTPDITAVNRLSDGMYIECNQAFLDASGYRREEVIGRTSAELGIWANAVDRQAMAEMMSESSGCHRLEAQFKKKNGEIIWGEISVSNVEIDGVPCLLSVTRDLSHAKAAENTIRSLAYYDPLTGLPNRRMLMEKLHQPPASGVQSNLLRALLMVDLDDFKTLNDALGHQKGDLLLQEVARRLAACVHESDVVSRLGGDEFVVMLEDLNEVAEEAANQTKAIGERILDSLGQPFLINEHEYLTTASIGITLFKGREDSTEDFLQQALIALHQARVAGRNVMRFFSPGLQATVNARATLEDDLRQAIRKEQFELYYQPQVQFGRLTGVEALIRWKHPSRGIVPPDEFIPMAEETGLILPLGEWILKAACNQIALWANGGQPNHFEVAVNISALQFRQPEFVEQVLAALNRAGSDPRTLKLELTESMLAENLDEVIAKMTELKSHGLRFSLDDFGTGYSSLAYLKRLPLDQMKIDRAFVHDMMVDATSGAIAQTILSLGRAMGLSVIAEGVETEEQRGFLAGLGCHSFQGFLFSHPLPLSEFQVFWENYSKKAEPLKK